MTTSPRHFLPDNIRDLAAPAAEHLEHARRVLLDYYILRGYEFVNPPLIEFARTLSSGAASDLKQNLVYLAESTTAIDTNTRLALRADFTPQVARRDSICAKPNEVRRYCYAGSILLRQPRTFGGVRNPMQLGAELLGSDSEHANKEALNLLLDSLIPLLHNQHPSLLRLSDNRIIALLCDLAKLNAPTRAAVLTQLQRRSLDGIAPLLKPYQTAHPEACTALITLPRLLGTPAALKQPQWQQLAHIDPQLAQMLQALEQLASHVQTTHPNLEVVLDLADMSGYTYHTALTFTLYSNHTAVAQGGRYDGIGRDFGCSRPAIGFSIDMDLLLSLLPPAPQPPCIWVDWEHLPHATHWIDDQRARSTRIVCALSADENPPNCCTHQLISTASGSWQTKPLVPANHSNHNSI